VDAAPAGSTVTVPACVYRELVTISKPLTLVAQPGAEIRGSDVWTGWTQSGSTWLSTGSVPSFYNPGGTCAPGTSRCLWPEQAFLDGTALIQVSTTSTPAAGQFKIDGSRRIVLGQNPAGHTVEVSTRQGWLWVASSDVTIDGFTMKHAATSVQSGGIQVGGSWVGAVNRVTIRNNALSDTHGRDINLEGGVGHRVLNNNLFRAGNIGIGGANGSDWLISGNYLHHNDTEDFDAGVESGGAKILWVDGLTVSNNEVAYNTRGIWTDTGVRNATFANNRLHHNSLNGIFLESGHYLTVSGNAAWENGWAGAGWAWGGAITLASSDHADVHDNTVAWNADGITVISQSRADDAPHVEINVHDNTIAMSPRSGDTGAYATGWVMDWAGILYNAASNNRGSNNHYWYPAAENSQLRFGWNGGKNRLVDYEPTPAETTTTYLTTGQKDSTLSAAALPTTAVAR
jgi:parallel beta-helix repeat protein